VALSASASYLVLLFHPADLSPKEAQYLLVVLHEWDITGSTRHSLTHVYAPLQLLKLTKVPLGAVPAACGPDRPDSRQSTTSTSLTSCTAATQSSAPGGPAAAALAAGREKALNRQQGRAGANANRCSNGLGADMAGSLANGMASLKEAYLSERVAALEAELAHARSSSGTASSQQVRRVPQPSAAWLEVAAQAPQMLATEWECYCVHPCRLRAGPCTAPCCLSVVCRQVEALRGEVARYQSRLAELENDFLSLDVVASTEVRRHA
jgi:hypothetical protein